MAENKLPYSRISEELNDKVTELMSDWSRLVDKAKEMGLDIKFATDSQNTLELYFNDDYPDTLLVDKDISCKEAFLFKASETSTEPYSSSSR